MGSSLLKSIQTISFFQNLSDEHLQRLSQVAVPRNFDKNEILFHEREEAQGFYGVVQGKIKVFKTSPGGKIQTLHIFGPGDPFAEVPVFTGTTFPASAQALEKSTCLYFSKKDLLSLLRKSPDLVLTILAHLSQKLKMLTAQIENLSLKEVPERLANYLLFLEKKQESRAFSLDIPKGELANLLGTSPETISRILKRLSKNNIISINGSKIQILDTHTLIDVAEGDQKI